MYLEGCAGWKVDKSTYILGYGTANVKLRAEATQRSSALHLAGLFETTLGSGVDYGLEILVPAGGTPGTLKLRNVDIIAAGVGAAGNVPLFDDGGGNLQLVGRIYHKNAARATGEVLALNGTPKTLVAAPGAGKYIVPVSISAFYDYNSAAYTGIAAGEDLAFRYTNGSGTIVAQIEATGFLDQTSDQHRVAKPSDSTTAFIQYTPTLNAALVAHLTTGEITTGNSPVIIFVDYIIHVDTN